MFIYYRTTHSQRMIIHFMYWPVGSACLECITLKTGALALRTCQIFASLPNFFVCRNLNYRPVKSCNNLLP